MIIPEYSNLQSYILPCPYRVASPLDICISGRPAGARQDGSGSLSRNALMQVGAEKQPLSLFSAPGVVGILSKLVSQSRVLD